MKYPDRFLGALGAWQEGWREQKDRRLAITTELRAAIAELASPLPVSSPLPLCYRKRYLTPNNPQNDGDFRTLVLAGRIDEGVASWTADKQFGEAFKDLIRDGCVTALFEHRPQREEVVVDLLALWQDRDFAHDAEAYSREKGNNATAHVRMRDKQSELILDAPLLSEEIVGFVGRVGQDDVFFEALGANTEDAQDAVWKALTAIDAFPGDAKWLGRDGAQRALNRTRIKYGRRFASRLWHLEYQEFLLGHSSLHAPALFRRR